MSTQEQQQPMTIQKFLEARREALAQVVPKHLTVDRLLKVALNSISKSEKLKKCTMTSVLQCVVTCAELGLEPGGALGGAYLIPFDDKKTNTTICTLVIGYRGYVDLMRRSGQLSTIRAKVVHERDKFKYREGIDVVLEHEPCLDGDPGAPRFTYCILKLSDGGVQVEVMSKAEVDAIRARSRASGYGPWVTDYEEMSKKTVIRRAAKLAPMSSELVKALEAEDEYVDGEVVRRGGDGVMALVSGEKVQAPAAPVAQLQAPRPEPIPSMDDGLEDRLRESVELVTGASPGPTPPAALSPEDAILAAIEAATKPADLNPIAARIGKLSDPDEKARATAAYSLKAKLLRGGAR